MSRIVLPASRRIVLLATLALLVFSVPFVSASPGGGKDKKAKASKVSANAPAQPGTPIMWADRGNVSSLDLYWGIGSEAGAPKPTPPVRKGADKDPLLPTRMLSGLPSAAKPL